MSIGEICNRQVVISRKGDSVRDAAKLMRTYHVGTVVVVEDGDDRRVPVGILTDRDIVLELIAADVDLDLVTVGDVMSFELVCVLEGDGVIDTIKKMRKNGVRRMPVVNASGSLEGIVTVDDLTEVLSEQLHDLTHLVVKGQERESEKRP